MVFASLIPMASPGPISGQASENVPVAIQTLLVKTVSKAAIAKIVGVSQPTLHHFIRNFSKS